MKRSEINNIMLEADEFIQKFGFKLPPFAYWSASQFKKKKADASEIIRSRCGWDITDYGCGKFHEMGLFLFTLRNGKLEHLSEALIQGNADAVLAASIFHFGEFTIGETKKFLIDQGIQVRI